MKNNKKSAKLSRKLKRLKNRDRVNRLKKQQMVVAPLGIGTLFIMVIIALRFDRLKTPEQVLERLRLHIQKLTGNLFFPTTDPTLVALQQMADDLQAAKDAVVAGDKAQIPHRNNLVKNALQMIRELSYDIQFQSKGDEEMIKSAGFDPRKTKSKLPPPGQVLVLVAKPVGPGKIRLRWKKEPSTKIYIIEQLNGNIMPPPNPMPNWEAVGKTSRCSFVVKDLVPGQLYYFRVFGTNGPDDGNPSDPAEQRSL